MILETLDIKLNDVFIYSENKFDFEKNFHIINKDDRVKVASPIHFNDVCRYIHSSDPKSVIVYRLLTNLSSFKTDIVKYGIMVIINGEPEVVHFDPVFAVKELEEYVKSNDIVNVRFRIQQVGLLSQISNFGKPNYSEVYAFDLEVSEARWQNDRVFAELIFAFDEVNFDAASVNKGIPKVNIESNRTAARFKKVTVEDVRKDLIEEDINYDAHKMRKLTYLPMPGPPIAAAKPRSDSANDLGLGVRGVIVSKPETEGLKEEEKKSFSNFLKNIKTESTAKGISTEGGQNKGNVIDLFKSSQRIHQYVVTREQKQIVLKLREE